MSIRVAVSVLTVLTMSVAGCARNEPQPESKSETAAPAADASHAEHAGGRVYFVSPKNGETIKTNAKFVFGSDAFEISPVPAGEVKEARAGVGHFHLGIDTECLPPGTVIPKAETGQPTATGAWIHFGKGDREIEMSLTPGRHKLTVQAGDDLHTTHPGLCESIEVNVVQ